VPDKDVKETLTADHKPLTDEPVARAYFAKFDRITAHLANVAKVMQGERTITETDSAILAGYLAAMGASFRALGMKYLIAGRLEGVTQRHLTMDVHESGFPVFQEIVTLANDAAQAETHLKGMPDTAHLKSEMIRQIVAERTVPLQLQYALSQRLYYQALAQGGLFFAQMHPQAIWIADVGPERRRFMLHWAVYDSQQNLPVIYLMEVEDTGTRALPKDAGRWPAAQAHLMAQSSGGLKLLTIAKGFDTDFSNLHPKRLRRIYAGPMYSAGYTMQTGPIRQVLEGAKAGSEDDWALAWTVEELESERVEVEKGWFSDAEREVFRLDPLTGVDSGATRVARSLILPQLPFQVLAEKDPEGFRSVRKFVVGKDGRVVGYA
jgi:hypothetical protein